MYKRRLMEVYQRYVQRRVNGLYRVPDGRALLRKYEETLAPTGEANQEDSRTVCR